jgi:hypothetical protein
VAKLGSRRFQTSRSARSADPTSLLGLRFGLFALLLLLLLRGLL